MFYLWFFKSNTILQESVQEKIVAWKKCQENQNSQSICHLLKLILISLEQKDALFLHDPKSFINLILEVLKTDVAFPQSALVVVTEISRIVLLSRHVHILQEDATKLIRKVSSMSSYFISYLYFIFTHASVSYTHLFIYILSCLAMAFRHISY